MRKQIWVVQCDTCGKTGNALLLSDRYNSIEIRLPNGWSFGFHKDVHLCPDCFNFFHNRYKEGELHV